MKRFLSAFLISALFVVCAQVAFGQLASSCWPKFRRDAVNSGQGLYGGTGSDLTWIYTAGGAIKSAPVVGVDGTCYFTSDDGRLYAIAGSGVKKWDFNCNCLGTSSPAVASDGTIYAPSANTYIYAINPNGSLKWKRSIASKVESSIAIGADGTIYFGAGNNLVALNPDSTQKWSFATGGLVSSSPAIGSDGTIYFGSSDASVYALYSTGAQKWKFTSSGSGGFAASPAIGTDGTIYIGSLGGYFFAVRNTGTQKWRLIVGGEVRSSAAVSPNGNIQFGCRNGKLYTVSSGGIIQWSFTTGSYVDSSPAVDADGRVFVASLDGSLYALNPDGTERWRYATGAGISSSPALGPAGSLILGGMNNILYCFAADPTPPVDVTCQDDGAYTSVLDRLHGSWSASDPQSGVSSYEYCIGTAPGLDDVATWLNVGSATTHTRTGLALVDKQMYYITVRAINGAGRKADPVSSDGITADATAATAPTVIDDGRFTSNAGVLHAIWNATDPESGVIGYQYAIGTSPGASNTVAWTDAGSNTQITLSGLSLASGTTYYFSVKALNGGGIYGPAGSSDGITLDLTPPTTPVVTDDGFYTIHADQLHARWSAADAQSGIARYEYSIGTLAGATDVFGWASTTSTDYIITGLSLLPGTRYYINVRAINGAGAASPTGSSDGIIVESTPPTTPVVTDGGDFTQSTTSLSARWRSEDPETGVEKFFYSIGTTPGAYNVVSWTDVGLATNVDHNNLKLAQGGTYYFNVKAVNGIGLVSYVGSSNGIVIDSSVPIGMHVWDDGEYTGVSNAIHARWAASDPESGIANYRYCVGKGPGLADIADWLDVGVATEHTRTSLSLVSGQAYYVTVVATNSAGGESAPVSSDGIRLDQTPPSTPVVTDTGTYWGYRTQISANWLAADAESGIAEYMMSVGTSPGATDVASWMSVGNKTTFMRTGLMLEDGVTYYINVKAKNGAGRYSAVGFSDGVLMDSTPPTTPVVTDDGDSTTAVDRLHATWKSSDPESGIAEYVYCLGTSPGATDIMQWTSAGLLREITVTDMKIEPMLTYYFSVRARSNSGAWSAVSASDGISYSYGAAIWWKFRNDAGNMGRGLFNATTVNDVAWIVQTQNYVESSPAIAADGATYIGSADGKLYAVTQNGTIRWTYDAGSMIDSSPAIAPDGKIVFGCDNGKVICISDDAELVWSYQVNGAIRSSPLIDEGVVYAASMNGSLYAINISNGAKLWSFATGDAIKSSPSIDANNNVYLGSGDNYVYAINSIGTLKWRFLTGSAVDSSPSIGGDGTIYIGSGDGHMYAINPNGTMKWRFMTGSFVDSSAAIGPNGNIYFGAGFDGGSGMLFALRPDKSVIWQVSMPGGIVSSPAIDPTGNIYVGACDDKIYAFRPNGTILWSYTTGSSVVSSPALGADSSVIFGSYDGKIYCLRDVNAKDLTPPTAPVVTVDGDQLPVGIPLNAAWSATDPESMVAEYTYAVGTGPSEPLSCNVVGWTSAGIETSVIIDSAAFTLGQTYYVSVKARNPSQRWSKIGLSQPVTVVNSGNVPSIANIKLLNDGYAAVLQNKVVTGVYSDCFFIEESTRQCAVRCLHSPLSTSLLPGDRVTISGRVMTLRGRKVLGDAICSAVASGAELAPLGMSGSAIKALHPELVKGLYSPLYVTVWGRASAVGTGYVVISDGSGHPELVEGLSARGAAGVEVWCDSTSIKIGDTVMATGVLCDEDIGSNIGLVVRTMSADDVRVISL